MKTVEEDPLEVKVLGSGSRGTFAGPGQGDFMKSSRGFETKHFERTVIHMLN